MEVNLTFRHIDPSDHIKRRVEEEVDKLKRHALKPEVVHVILGHEKFRWMAEITLTDNGNVITATDESAGNIYEALDSALDKVSRQLKKRKGRVISHKKHIRT